MKTENVTSKRAKSLLAALAFVAASSAPASIAIAAQPTPQNCEARWSNLPQLLPSPGYVSSNDPDLAYQNVVVRNRYGRAMWGTELAKSIKTFFQMRQVVASWETQLLQSEKAYWNAFDTSERVPAAVANEFAYWLHKRETWLDFKSNYRFAMQDVGAGQLADLLTGGETFLRPYEFNFAPGIRLKKTFAEDLANAEYREHFQRLLHLSFLKNSRCAPSKDSNSEERIAFYLLYPFGDARQAVRHLRRLQQLAIDDPSIIEQLAGKLETHSSPGRNGESIVSVFLSGDRAFADRESLQRFKYWTRNLDSLKWIGFDEALRKPKDFRIGDEYFGPVIPEALRACVFDNWETLQDYVYKTNPSFLGKLNTTGDKRAVEREIDLKREFATFVVRACISEAGVNTAANEAWIANIKRR